MQYKIISSPYLKRGMYGEVVDFTDFENQCTATIQQGYLPVGGVFFTSHNSNAYQAFRFNVSGKFVGTCDQVIKTSGTSDAIDHNKSMSNVTLEFDEVPEGGEKGVMLIENTHKNKHKRNKR